MKTFRYFLEATEYKKLSRKLKVSINVDRRNPFEHKNTWKLEGISREEGSVAGSGAKVMKAFHKAADEHNKSVKLYPTGRSSGRRGKSKLVDYYKSLGYKSTSDNGMIRHPKKRKSKL